MENDSRVDDLHEMAAIGNLKAVLHYCQSGVNINAQNRMNGWTALHWATHRGHEPIVRALLMRGARKDIQNKKGETPVDIATKPDICALYNKEVAIEPNNEDQDSSTPKFVPAYLAQPDLSKLWSLPDGSTDDPKLNQEAFALSNPGLQSLAPAPKTEASVLVRSSAAANGVSSAGTNDSYVAKEILVYDGSVADDNILGSIFANIEDTIEKTIHQIREEIDDIPEEFNIGRYNGSKVVPINMKQLSRKTGDMFRGQDDAIVLMSKAK
ncbi:hypothetical protein BGZ46_006574 [Entomortierella lignicola]|nr:hypothetical protein BGZ46_006574 [Entomortierella lignicola]